MAASKKRHRGQPHKVTTMVTLSTNLDDNGDTLHKFMDDNGDTLHKFMVDDNGDTLHKFDNGDTLHKFMVGHGFRVNSASP